MGNSFPKRHEPEEKNMPLSPAERRRAQRLHVQIPIFVRGTDPAGMEFLDLTKTLDISATGAYLAIQARVRRHNASHGIHLLGVEFLKALD
jgi:hypothetical protein